MKPVDLHMTDSTAHNKGVAAAKAQLMGRKDGTKRSHWPTVL